MTLAKELPFDEVKTALAADILGFLEQWFPNGKKHGREYHVGNLRGDPGESLRINLDTGKWQDFADLSSPRGNDLLSLYAAAHCGGSHKAGRTAACKELAAELGLRASTSATSNKVVPLYPKEPKEKAKDDWKSMVPPPDGVGIPNLGTYTHKHIYRGPGGVILRYVARVEHEDGKKDFYPHTYGTLNGVPGWHKRHPNDPLCLYGLDARAARPDAPVLLQEGELKTDQVGRVLGERWCCMGWSGGVNMVGRHDFKPGVGAEVYVSGDVGGEDAAFEAADILHRLGAATVWTVDLAGFPKGWDLGNAATGIMVKMNEVVWRSETGPWTAEQIEAFLKERRRPFNPNPGAADDGPDWGDEPREPGKVDKRSLPPTPLGYDSGHYYYLSPMTGQIEVLARRSHTKHELIGIASLQYYNTLEHFKGAKGGLNWEEIGDYLKGQCSDVGIFRPDIVRGRGAYLDVHRDTGEVRAVLNLGDRLLVGDQSLPLELLSGSTFIYEAARPLKYAIAPPLTREQAGQVAELCKLFSWEKPIYGVLMAGWLAVAPICGALFWRPAIWITGGSGSGKSTLETLIAKPLLGGICLFLKGGTTEAGIRQKLGRDALPLWFDEAEAESPKSKATLQGVLDLNRQSSSEGGAEIVKGTQNQTGAKTYHVRSCFAFSSINPTLDHMADENRMSVLELTNHGAADREDFDARVVEPINRIMTPEFCAGFVARSVWLMPVILDNARTFSKAVSIHLGSSRIGDQIGTLLAGAFSQVSDNRVTLEAARKWVEAQDWGGATSADALTDERRLLNHLMQRRTRLDLGGNKFEDVTLAELVKYASGAEECSAVAGCAQTELKRHGMKYEDGGIWVSNTHTALKEHLKDTPWSSQWARTLRRLPGTKPLDREAPAIKFAGELGRATFVPLDLTG